MIATKSSFRFWSGVTIGDDCWEWTRSKNKKGYGQFKDSERTWLAHRYAYLFYNGSIDPSLTIDHLCRRRSCVRPDHLEQVTNLENQRRANALVSKCKRGHEFNVENTYRIGSSRFCRKCGVIRSSKYRNRILRKKT